MSGWRILLGDDPSPLTIDAQVRFNLQTRVQDNDTGDVDYIETWVEVEGDIVGATASAVTASIATLQALCRSAATTRVRLQLDAIDKFDYSPINCMASPRMIFFKTVDDDGNADSHWRYAFTIYVKQAGAGGQQDISELQTSVKTVSEQGRIIRKIWSVSVKGLSMSAALATAMSCKPSAPYLHEEIKKDFKELRVSAGWIWEVQRGVGIIEIIEDPISYTRLGNDYLVSTQVGARGATKNPILHQLAQNAAVAHVRGVVIGYISALLIPAAHWTESSDLKRWKSQENNSPDAQLESLASGKWRRTYEEVWISTTGTFPAPNHGNDHHDLAMFPPPGDGPIAAA